MKRCKKPSRSWTEKSIEEIEKEALKEGFEAGARLASELALVRLKDICKS